MKKIIPLLVLVVLLSSVVLAQEVPKGVRGYLSINGDGSSGLVVEVENLRTGEVLSGLDRPQLVSEPGGFFFDMSWFKDGYFDDVVRNGVVIAPGDTLEVRVKGGDPVVSFSVPNGDDWPVPYLEVDLRIEGVVSGDKFFQCAGGNWVVDVGSCPRVVSPDPVVVEKEVIKEVVKEVEVPVSDEGDLSQLQLLLLGMIAAVIGIFSWGKGFAGLIKWRLGKAKDELRIANAAKNAGDMSLYKVHLDLSVKHQKTAEKMSKTVLTNFMAGKYKK